MKRCREVGLAVPTVHSVDPRAYRITMEYISDALTLRDHLNAVGFGAPAACGASAPRRALTTPLPPPSSAEGQDALMAAVGEMLVRGWAAAHPRVQWWPSPCHFPGQNARR